MSGILYKEYKESRQRSVIFLTVLPPKDWRWIVSRFLEADGSGRRANDIDVSRDDSSKLTCHEVTLTLPMDGKSPNQLLELIFGNDFLKTHLPITEKRKMGNTAGVFVRMGSVANPMGPPSSDEEFALYSLLTKRGGEMSRRHWECVKEFDKDAIIEKIVGGVVADVEAVRTQAKKHRIEGGSWLLYPKDRNKEQQLIQPVERNKMCKRAFDRVVKEFLEGTLVDSNVTRVTYTLAKGVIKVFNPKSEYFEESAKNPRPDLKQIYAADIQVNQAYMKLSQMGLLFMRLKYKPEIFTVWKLHASDAQGGILTLYHDVPHPMKMEIAQDCFSSSPAHPGQFPSPNGTLTPGSVPTPTPSPTVP